MTSIENYKEEAAQAAVAEIEKGMVVGIGHGSTVHFAIQGLAQLISTGELADVVVIPCSQESQRKAENMGILIVDFNSRKNIDITIDGADEIDPAFNLIKGGGGALLREKMLAQESKRVIIIADHNKLSPKLGTNFSLPLEISKFGWAHQIDFIEGLGGNASLRKYDNDEMVLTDQENYLLDCHFGAIEDLDELAKALEKRAGILEHGLFLNLATDVIIAGADGILHHRDLRG